MPKVPVGVGRRKRWFEAKWDGVCSCCGETLHAGDQVRFMSDQIVGTCCDGEPPAGVELVELESPFDLDVRSDTRLPGFEVMPRGKSAKDLCKLCFMIHAGGQTGCE